jgi:hypothetical protein
LATQFLGFREGYLALNEGGAYVVRRSCHRRP